MKSISAFTTFTVSSLPNRRGVNINKNNSIGDSEDPLDRGSESLTQEQYIMDKLEREDLTALAQYCLGFF